MSPLQPGTTLGRYQILAALGHGGMATVYKAYQPAIDRTVALKVLREGVADDQDLLERFRREAKAVGRLRHPHIIQLHDFDEVDGQLFMVMEHVDGGTLKERTSELHRAGQLLPLREVARIVSEVADGLGYAHSVGIIHRDIKPSNILLTRDGKAIISDFGIARILAGVQTTQTGVGFGTPEYMSPEQAQGATIDQRSDVYSLGIVAYELLTGHVPFTADTPLAIVLAHVRDPLPLPSSRNPRVGEATDRAVMRALAKSPDDRYPSAPEFADQLTRAIGEDEQRTAGTVIRRKAAIPAASIAAAASHATPRAITVPLSRGVIAAALAIVVLALGGGGAAALGLFGMGAGPAGNAVPGRTVAGSVTASGANPVALATGTSTPSRSQAAVGISSSLPTATLPPSTPAPTQPPAPVTFNPATAPYRITGRVTSAVTGAPLSGFQVSAFAADSCCSNLADARTDGAGGFSLAVGGGNYRVQVTPDVSTGYAHQFWRGAISNTDGSVISVSGANVGQIDFVMQPGFLVSGTVTSASTGATVGNAFVHIVTNDHVWGGPTDSAGRWQARLVNSSYRIEFYQSSPCCSGQQPVQTVPLTISGKDVVVNGQVR